MLINRYYFSELYWTEIRNELDQSAASNNLLASSENVLKNWNKTLCNITKELKRTAVRETYWKVTARKLDDNINNESSSTPDLQEEVVSLTISDSNNLRFITPPLVHCRYSASFRKPNPIVRKPA